MKDSEGNVLEHCEVKVDCEGNANVAYRWAFAEVDGCDSFGEDVSDWSADEIRKVAAMIVDICEGINEIKVERV